MESFELIDNFFQIVVLLCAAAAAGIFALRRRSRDLLILSLAYACFAMGTIYYVLYLVIIGIWPQVFYVAEISWLAAWLFYLSAQILRTEGMKCRFSLPAGATAAVMAAVAASPPATIMVVRVVCLFIPCAPPFFVCAARRFSGSR